MSNSEIGTVVANSACETYETIRLFPFRYTLKPKDRSKQAYAYDNENLFQKFPEMEVSQYAVRHLRKGFVYLWNETRAIRLIYEVTGSGLQAITMKDPHGIKKYSKDGNETAYIAIRADDKVHLCFSDTLLSNQRLADIELNRNSIRKRMTTINGSSVLNGELDPDCFEVCDANTQVEDYKYKYLSRRMKTYFDWSGHGNPFPATADAMTTATVGAEASAAVVLFDNIGMTQDMTSLIESARDDLQVYVSKDNQANARKLFASNIIDNLHAEDEHKFRVRLSKHLHLKTKSGFDEEYRRTSLRFQVLLRKRKRDRCELLKTYTSKNKLSDLGTSFSFYDTSNPISSIAHAQAFCGCMRGMMSDPEVRSAISKLDYRLEKINQTFENYEGGTYKNPKTYQRRKITKTTDSDWLKKWVTKHLEDEGIINTDADTVLANEYYDSATDDPEKLLFATWWAEKDASINPILCNLDYDSPEPAKTYKENLLSLKMTDSVYEDFSTFAMKDGQDRKAHILEKAADITEDLYSRLGKSLAVTELVRNIQLHAMKNYQPNKPLPRTTDMDTIVQKRLGIPTRANTKKFLDILKRQYGNDPEFGTLKLSRNQYLYQLFDAAGLSSTETRIIHKMTDSSSSQLVDFFVVDKETKWSMREKPFGNKLAGSVTGLCGILLFINLFQAVDDLGQGPFELHEVTNLFSAIAGALSGIQNGMKFTITILNSYGIKTAIKAGSPIDKFLSGKVGRMFGVVSAVFDFLTFSMKSFKAAKADDTDAAVFYAGAAIAIGGGGLVLAFASTAFMAVCGIAFMVGGIWFLYEAAKAEDLPIEKWLNACIFGTHSKKKSYKNANEEYVAYMYVLYSPVILDYDWQAGFKDRREKIMVTVLLPYKDKYFRMRAKRGKKEPYIDTTITKYQGYQWSQGTVPHKDEYQERFTSVKDVNTGVRFTHEISNIVRRHITQPNEMDYFTYKLMYIPKNSVYEEWLELKFRIERWGWGFDNLADQDIEYLDAKL